MKRLLVALVLLAAFLSAVTARGVEAGGEEAAIQRAALDYMEGWYEADAERMKRALHPDLAKRRVLPGPLFTLTASRLIEMTGNGGGSDAQEAKKEVQIVVLDVSGDIASARVESPHFYEYMHLARIDGEWRIVNILWKKNE